MIIDLKNIPVFYINLDKDVDKATRTEKVLKDLGFKNVKRVSGVSGDNDFGVDPHVFGCGASHLKILKSQLEYPFIILEDDIDYKNFMDKIDVPDDVDFLYLGTYLHNATDKFSKFKGMYSWLTYDKEPPSSLVDSHRDIRRVRDLLATHAIAYFSKDAVEQTIPLIEFGIKAGIPIDVTLAKCQFIHKTYAINEPIFWQNDKRKVMSQITTVFSMDQIQDIIRNYPKNFEYIAYLYGEELNKIYDGRKQTQ